MALIEKNYSLDLQSIPEFEHSIDADRRFKNNLKFVKKTNC